MKPDAPLLFEDMITRGVEPAPTKPSNISKRLEFKTGDLDAGFAAADVVIEKEFKTAAVHQAYIEPHACVARCDADGQAEIWSSSQGHFQMRALTAQILGMKIGGIQGVRPDVGFVDVGEDRREEGRHAGCRRRHLQVPGRRIPWLAGDERLPLRIRAVQHPRTACGRL
jgi:hypothetical protein